MIIDRQYVLKNRGQIIKAITRGQIIIYPTDTIYGIGCNAFDKNSVNKIRELKRRETKPFSVIVPGKIWVRDNCELNKDVEKYLKKLPGPYTLFLRLRSGVEIPAAVNPSENGTIGIRIPKHWFKDLISEAGVPFVTTSVNISGRPHMTNLHDLDESIKNNVDFIIYEGEINGRESIKIDLTKL